MWERQGKRKGGAAEVGVFWTVYLEQTQKETVGERMGD